jgi:hypothetical protein
MELCGVIRTVGCKKGKKFRRMKDLISHNGELHITLSPFA